MTEAVPVRPTIAAQPCPAPGRPIRRDPKMYESVTKLIFESQVAIRIVAGPAIRKLFVK